MKTLILANGDPPSSALARSLTALHDFVIATDGAAHKAALLGIEPNLICGDFDSVHEEKARTEFPETEFLATPDQERSDLEKAILVSRERGATAITLTGTGGGRSDHLLAAYALLLRYHRQFPLQIVEDGGRVFALSGGFELMASPGDTLSLLTFDENTKVTLAGVKWELNSHPLQIGTHGVSNVVTSPLVRLSSTGGALLVCHLPLNSDCLLPF